jgi:hypothetical protein
MKLLIVSILAYSLAGCSSHNNIVIQNKTIAKDTTSLIQPPVIERRAAVKQNLTLVGAIIDSVELIDSLNYKFHVQLQTAIPEAGYESVVEPGQVLSLYPAYQLNENNIIDMNNPVNKKLIQMRILKKKAFIIARITFENDMKWYIIQVEAFQNAPEGNKK